MVRCLNCAALCAETHSFCFACGTELGPASSKTREDPLLGQTLPGGYRVTHLVGVGGMGRVYCAEQVALGRTVAVKVVHPHLADDERTGARFLNEARAASRLSHPNSVAIFDFGRTADGHPYIVMEYLRGRDLGRVAQGEGPLPLRRVVDILRQTLVALDEAHALGILHRDLKPDNIVLEPLRSGLDFVKVVDFGLAKLLKGDALNSPTLSSPGLVCGTPEYMSPEQARGDALDGRSDLYSVGVVLFELLAGRVPFVADTVPKTLLLHLTEPAPDPRDVVPERAIPAPFAKLAIRALAKSREDRMQTARGFADALDAALLESEGRPPLAEAPPSTGMRCAVCSTSSPLGQKFCGNCGAAIAPRPLSVIPPPREPARESSAPSLAPASPRPRRSSAPPSSGPRLQGDERPSRPLANPLLDRDDAMGWLEARFAEASTMPAAAHVVGETGMGKTRLVTEALARWARRGDSIVTVGPDPAWAKIGDWTVRRAILELTGLRAEELAQAGDAGPAALAGSVGRDAKKGLTALFGRDPASPHLGADERRAGVAEALRWALERASSRSRAASAARVVLFVDDLDFIDGTSRNAFADVLAAPPPVPVLLIVAYMPGTRPVSDPMAGEVWRLAALPYDSVVTRIPLRYLAHGTAISPLHMQELVAWFDETTETPPERLADVVSRRIERLPPSARHALQALAVWGDDADQETLTRLLPSGMDVVPALDSLYRAQMVVAGNPRIRIAHPMMRLVALSAIPAGRKRELFAQAAEIATDGPMEVRAKHAAHGGSALEALSLLDALAVRRTLHGDLGGTVSALHHALELARREIHRGELDDPLAATLVFSRKLAEALAALQRWSDAEGVLHEALGSAPPASEHRAHLLGVMARVANARRHPGDARRYLDEAMRVARQSDLRGLMPILEGIEKTIAVA
jgi:serine/threonine protein kinase